MTGHDDILGLIPSYALGALEGDDARRLEEHLERGCESCEAELLASTRQVEALAELAPPAPPSEMMRARLERELDHRTTGTRPRWVQRAAIIALALLAVWSLWTQSRLRDRVDQERTARVATGERLTQVERQLEQTQSMLNRLARAGRIISAPGSRNVVLAGLDPTPGASAQTFVDPLARSAVFYASGLPALSPEETYQLWFIADGVPVSAGIFDVEDDGTAMVLVDDTAAVDDIQLWAVTIEPAGGVPQPTGAMVLKG